MGLVTGTQLARVLVWATYKYMSVMDGGLGGEAAVESRAVYSIIHGQKIGVFCLSFAWSGKGVTEAMSPDFFGGAAHGKLGSREEAKAPFV